MVKGHQHYTEAERLLEEVRAASLAALGRTDSAAQAAHDVAQQRLAIEMAQAHATLALVVATMDVAGVQANGVVSSWEGVLS